MRRTGRLKTLRPMFPSQHRRIETLSTYAHLGALDRRDRNDPVFALADLISGLDSVWAGIEADGGRATVTFGEVSTDPLLNAFAKIPGEVRFCLDVRSAEPKLFVQIESAMNELVTRIERERGVRFELERFSAKWIRFAVKKRGTTKERADSISMETALGERTASTPAILSATLVRDLAVRAETLGLRYRLIASGAGHDTAVLANRGVPSTMVFVRNQKGSHNPNEGMRIEDLCAAA